MTSLDAEAQDAIDAALSKWRQGDCVVGDQWFVHRFSPDSPLTQAAAAIAAEGTDVAEDAVAGLVVLTQTCDIVRSCKDRQYLEVAPLVEVDDQVLRESERGRRPRYAFVPGVADRRLVADLDRVMTIEKAIAAKWDRVLGSGTDSEARSFAQALARKRSRFAFPDDFSLAIEKLHDRLLEKHDKQTREGQALRSLREIRVQASPSWNSKDVELILWFIREPDATDFDGTGWDELLEDWLKMIPATGRYRSVEGAVVALDDLTARDYVDSDPLDLDFVTTRVT